MAICTRADCANEVPASAGYKPRQYCSPACRAAASRERKPKSTRSKSKLPPIDATTIMPGDDRLVERVAVLVAPQLAADSDEVAAAQAALALKLSALAADGSVSAARELRLQLLELRVASDPTFEGTPSQALVAEALLLRLGAGKPGPEGRQERPLPPGWHGTARDGELLQWLGHR